MKTIQLGVLAACMAVIPVAAMSAQVETVVMAARTQIGTTVTYDPGYRRLGFPNGDVPADRGVCTDVVIRALRSSLGLDLQMLVHEDMKQNFRHYPKIWGLKGTDTNIDHRRVPNLQTYFKRQGWALPVTRRAGDYKAGDLVTSLIPPHLPHIMIVSDKKSRDGRPLVIHNIGSGTREEDRLFEFEITGHYRIPVGR
jgi:uncharacterized protein YijF (DUF1287 family)